MELRELALRLGLALALGFTIGLERGWKERADEAGRRTAGLRTYTLIGLLGGVFGLLSLDGGRLLLAAGFVMTGAALAVFMWREGERDNDFSATSHVAALLTFMLGALAVLGEMKIAAGAGVATAMLLAHKTTLHGWLARITWTELRSGLLLAAMTFIALPLLPDRPLDPWNALNPHVLWLMTILIAAVSFTGYVAVKLAGPRRGLVLTAAMGGLFASTAVTLSLARLAPGNAAQAKLLAGAILAAGAVMMVRVLVIAGLISLPLAGLLAPPLLTAAAMTGLAAVFFIRAKHPGGAAAGKGMVHKNPFLLSEVLRFGALLAAVMAAAAIATQYFGGPGLLTVAGLAGLADVDAITLSVARTGDVSAVAVAGILLAVGVNTVAKSVYAGLAGGWRLALLLAGPNMLAIAAAAAVGYLLWA